ncbi:MAG TPA: chorismate synthase [Candidatus Obscuribacterales bacterium]
MLRFLTSGESHGPALIALIEGLPRGVPLNIERINEELRRRQLGYGRGSRQKIESDRIEVLAGVRHGITTGAPITFLIRNRDFENWKYVMSSDEVDVSSPDVSEQLAKKAIENFRPGHADLAGTLKFDQSDIRDVLERASARETAARVAAGALCQELLAAVGVRAVGHVIQVGSVKSSAVSDNFSLAEIEERALQSELFCIDGEATEGMKALIKKCWQDGDSLGGVVEVLVEDLPVGLGSYTQWDRKLDGRLAQAVMSIQAFKAVEVGDGVRGAGLPGSSVHDALYPAQAGSAWPFSRRSNRAGGLEGGMTNGERLVVRGYMKPLPTMRAGLDSLSFPDFEAARAHYERSDVCAIAAASVVMKAMVCFVLADALLDKFASDTLADLQASLDQYVERVRKKAAPGLTAPRAGKVQKDEDPDSIGEF